MIKWAIRLLIAVIAAAIAYAICYILVVFLPDLPGVGAQVAGIVATFTKMIVVIVFLVFLFLGPRFTFLSRFYV